MAFDFNERSLPYSANYTVTSAAQLAEQHQKIEQMAYEAYENRQKIRKEMEETANNTANTNSKLEKIIENQNAYICLLNEQLSSQKRQLEIDKQQLNILKDIFASEQDGVNAEKEIMNLIQTQIDSSHPLWDYVKDKAGDVAVAGITAGAPVIFTAVKAFLASKGINLL